MRFSAGPTPRPGQRMSPKPSGLLSPSLPLGKKEGAPLAWLQNGWGEGGAGRLKQSPWIRLVAMGLLGVGPRRDSQIKDEILGLPGGPVVTTPRYQCRGTGSIPQWGTKTPPLGVARKRSCNLRLQGPGGVRGVAFPGGGWPTEQRASAEFGAPSAPPLAPQTLYAWSPSCTISKRILYPSKR